MIQYDCTSGKMFKPQIFKSLFSPHGMTEIPPYVALKELFDVVGKYATRIRLPAEKGLIPLSRLVW